MLNAMHGIRMEVVMSDAGPRVVKSEREIREAGKNCLREICRLSNAEDSTRDFKYCLGFLCMQISCVQKAALIEPGFRLYIHQVFES